MKQPNLRRHTLIFILVFVASLGAFAQGPAKAEPAKSAESKDQKLDVSDLEKRYWAAKDTDFSVVQNRLYSKANRFALSVAYGTLLNDVWSDAPTTMLTANYYLSERYGVELNYSKTASSDSQALSTLKSQSGFADHGKIKGYYGVSFNWVPFYAKMSVLNSKIIYFDMSFSPGIGMTQYEQQREQGGVTQNSPTISLDLTQHFFLTNWFAIRVDFKNRWFQEEIVKYRIASQNLPSQTQTSKTSILLFGVTFYY